MLGTIDVMASDELASHVALVIPTRALHMLRENLDRFVSLPRVTILLTEVIEESCVSIAFCGPLRFEDPEVPAGFALLISPVMNHLHRVRVFAVVSALWAENLVDPAFPLELRPRREEPLALEEHVELATVVVTVLVGHRHERGGAAAVYVVLSAKLGEVLGSNDLVVAVDPHHPWLLREAKGTVARTIEPKHPTLRIVATRPYLDDVGMPLGDLDRVVY